MSLFALDIAHHFVKNIDEGLKGQLACDSKLSAIRYKKYLDDVGLFESAVVMSPPDTREGNTEVDESKIPEVTKMVERQCWQSRGTWNTHDRL
ncbi:hypothetical protein [Legionella pneumophila]|uniref:hypothetical protein n=1 Tax=Legionella pneumophila TaxID=446 RepID=UPI00090958ED|nr:hypothetical protein [Legionella pneumophila]SFZ34061.1 Uncharacterised protein [Legionella pneumophila]